MSGTITLARPYAKAIFEHALAQNKLSLWSQVLDDLDLLVKDKAAYHFLRNPNVTTEQQIELLQTPFLKNMPHQELEIINNFLELLARNKRIFMLPEIASLFDLFRADHQKTLTVKVRSFSKFTVEQERKLKEALAERLKREVTLSITLDPSLIGGAVIQANNLVIDGSVRGQLEKLRMNLIA